MRYQSESDLSLDLPPRLASSFNPLPLILAILDEAVPSFFHQ
jgi:hypothetical protein